MKQGDVFLIVGLGLMGGSYAMGLTKKGYSVLAVDSDPASIAWALERGIICEGGGEEQADALLGRADYVLLALYPKDILPWLGAHKEALKPGAMLTDLCGVKSCFVDEAQALLAPEHEFIPSHPMAGREVSGVQNATDAMFVRANFLITPTPRNTPEGVAFAQELAEVLGFAHTTLLGVAEHDAMIGYVSQLTHAIAVSLMNANADPRLPAVTGDSFRDLTRIADINGELWSELFLANAPALTGEIDVFVETLENLKRKLAAGDKEGLKELFAQSAARRREFGKRE